jgi:triacylglycerol esterase/lipase EstA (alpha/beta hydrolase family)
MLRRICCAVAVALAATTAVSTAGAQTLPVPYGGSAIAQAVSAAIAAGSPAGSNTGCRPSVQHPYPVVLVHATLANQADNWVTLSPLLANAGYCVYSFNYGQTALSLGFVDGLGDIPTSAGQLATFVNQVLARTGASQVDLVGHSQGGMMPSYYIKRLGGAAKVNTFVALAPSNHGTTLDGLVNLINASPTISGFTVALAAALGAPALVQQEVGSPFEKALFADGDTVAGPRYAVIETSHDEVVTPYANAFLSGAAANILVQSQCPSDPVGHIGMFEDSPALQNVLNQLSSAPNPAFRASCTNYGLAL